MVCVIKINIMSDHMYCINCGKDSHEVASSFYLFIYLKNIPIHHTLLYVKKIVIC